jgi:hypothetical protein
MKISLPPIADPPSKDRRAMHDAIAAYAAEVCNTDLDLDRDLESAGVDYLANAPFVESSGQ